MFRLTQRTRSVAATILRLRFGVLPPERKWFQISAADLKSFKPEHEIEIPEVDLYRYVFGNLDKARENEPAVICGVSGKSYTYKDMMMLSKKVGISLQQSGYRKGDVVAVYSPNVPEYIITLLGCAYAGIVVALLNPLSNVQEIQNQLIVTNTVAFFVFPKFAKAAMEAREKAPKVREMFVYGVPITGATTIVDMYLKVIYRDRSCWPFNELINPKEGKHARLGAPWFAEEININPREDLMIIPFSSGTTGVPKPVAHSHFTLISFVEQLSKYPYIKEFYGLGFLAVLPMFHIFGCCVSILPMKMEGKLVTNPLFQKTLFLKSIQKYSLGILPVVPPLVMFLATDPIVKDYDLSSIRAIFCGGAALQGDTTEKFLTRFPHARVTQGYAMTEGIFTSSIKKGIPKESVGQPFPNVEVKVLHLESGEELSNNEEGELLFKSPSAMIGYLNNKKATENAFHVDENGERWLRSGDVGYVNDEGNIFLVDRCKELIKYKGHQVSPVEIEEVICSMKDVTDAAVIGKPCKDFGELPIAFVMKKEGSSVTEKEVEEFIIEHMSHQNHLRGGVIFTDSIPRSIVGKILRLELKKILAQMEEKNKKIGDE